MSEIWSICWNCVQHCALTIEWTALCAYDCVRQCLEWSEWLWIHNHLCPTDEQKRVDLELLRQQKRGFNVLSVRVRLWPGFHFSALYLQYDNSKSALYLHYHNSKSGLKIFPKVIFRVKCKSSQNRKQICTKSNKSLKRVDGLSENEMCVTLQFSVKI